MQIYAAHFRQLDFFPIWSASDSYGLGSPLPLYYHKLFFMVSAGIYLLLGNIKSTFTASIAFFMVIGVYGMRAALNVITSRKFLAAVGGLGLIFTNYAFTDWLVRGDLAEFSAMMLVPWLLWWCLKLVEQRSVSYQIIPIVVILVLAHNLIALSATIVLLIAVVTCLAFGGITGFRGIVRRLLISAVSVTLLLSPLIVTQLAFNQYYDPASKAIQGGFLATRNFVTPTDYFWYGNFRWLTDRVARSVFRPDSLAVQIDFSIWIPVALALPFLIVALIRRQNNVDRHRLSPATVFVTASLIAYLFLQFSASAPIYQIFRPLELLQFPWRLMAFITPLGIIAVVMIADVAFAKVETLSVRLVPLFAVAWLASLIALSPVFSTFMNYGFIPNSSLVAPRYDTFGRPPLIYGAEYLPQINKESGLFTWAVYLHLLATRDLAESLPPNAKPTKTNLGTASPSSTRCTVLEPKRTGFESLHIRLMIRCNHPTLLALPISFNPYTTISVIESDGHLEPVPYRRLRNDPRIVIHVSSTQPEVLSIVLPTLLPTLRHVLFG